MLLTGTNQYNRRGGGPVPVSKLYPPQILRGLAWDRNWTSSVRRRRLSVSAVARPESPVELRSTVWFFCFSVKLRIDELCKQPEKMMVHLYPTHKSGIHGVLTSSQRGVLRHGKKPHLIKDLTNQKFSIQI